MDSTNNTLFIDEATLLCLKKYHMLGIETTIKDEKKNIIHCNEKTKIQTRNKKLG